MFVYTVWLENTNVETIFLQLNKTLDSCNMLILTKCNSSFDILGEEQKSKPVDAATAPISMDGTAKIMLNPAAAKLASCALAAEIDDRFLC